MSKSKFLILFLLTSLLSIYSNQKESKHFIIHDMNNLASEFDIKHVIGEAEKGYENITGLLKIRAPGEKINIYIVNSGNYKSQNNEKIILPISYIKQGNAPVILLTSYILNKNLNNKFYQYGLAVFFQETFGSDRAYYNGLGLNINDLINQYIGELYPLNELITQKAIFNKYNTIERNIAIIQAGSFLRFLYEKYGKNKFSHLYRSKNQDYRKVYAKSLNDLESEWLKHINHIDGFEIKESLHFKIVYKKDAISLDEAERVLNKSEEGYADFCQLFHIEERSKKLKIISIIDKGPCFSNNYGEIFIPIYQIRNNTAESIHEMTHTLTKYRKNKLFMEGLAVFMHYRHELTNVFGDTKDFIKELNKYEKSKLIPIKELNNNTSIYYQWGSYEKKLAYHESGSFITFLFDIYGQEKLIELFHSETTDFAGVYGKPVLELEKEWMEYIN